MPSYLHHNNVDALLWLQTSAEWCASYLQAYALARARIVEFMRTAQPGKRYCITTDLDETLFDNSAYNEWLAATGRNFDEAGSWDRYCRAKVSLAMPGVEDFYDWLAAAHPDISVFFVTSRAVTLREATAANLQRFQHVPAAAAAASEALSTSLFMKGLEVDVDGAKGADKYTHYRFIEQVRGFETILRLGDNGSDFHPDFGSNVSPAARLAAAATHAGKWGREWIQFPNPVYGGFLLSLRNPDHSAITEDQGTARGMTDDVVREPRTTQATPKMAFLDPWTP